MVIEIKEYFKNSLYKAWLVRENLNTDTYILIMKSKVNCMHLFKIQKAAKENEESLTNNGHEKTKQNKTPPVNLKPDSICQRTYTLQNTSNFYHTNKRIKQKI